MRGGRWRIGTVCLLCLARGSDENCTCALTVDVFRDGLRQRLNAPGEIPGVLFDVEAQLFGAVHLRLHLLLKLWGKTDARGEIKTG